ncbi:MAG: acyltransferase, partial [Clostridia bacterium]|nr:acyltransferase [Clostridia bacterium]
MRPTKDNRRILWVERVQVLSMLLVVLHHCVPHGYDGPQWLFNLLNAIQYPALVCFFLTSGLFAIKWRRDGWGAYMKRRCLRLLPPYFCVNLLMLLPRYVAARLMGVEAHLTVGWVLMSFLDPHGQGIAPHLWFLPTLLIMAALLPLIEAAVGGNRGLLLGTIAALLIGSALPVRLPTLFCCNELKLYLAWYVIGYALARRRGTACPLR